jgi:hypothetical protein
MDMCARNIGRVAETGAWANPLSTTVDILGAASLVITLWLLLGKSIPLITDARAALLIAAALIGAKFLVSAIRSSLVCETGTIPQVCAISSPGHFGKKIGGQCPLLMLISLCIILR